MAPDDGILRVLIKNGVRLHHRNGHGEDILAWVVRHYAGLLQTVVLALLKHAYDGDKDACLDDICQCAIDRVLTQKQSDLEQQKRKNVSTKKISAYEADIHYLGLLRKACMAREARNRLARAAMRGMQLDIGEGVAEYYGPSAVDEHKRMVQEYDANEVMSVLIFDDENVD